MISGEGSVFTIINSPNGRFFLRTIPFDNIIESSDGKTLVFNSDSVLLYEVDRYFDVKNNECELFLSNDGNTIAYVIDREFSKTIGSFGIIIDPIDNDAKNFYQRYDFIELPDSKKMFKATKTLKDLFE